MGAWSFGPFANDAARDWIAALIDHVMETIDAFLAAPRIDDGFDEAFAAVAILSQIVRATGSVPMGADGPRDGAPIRAAMLRCFDEQIDALRPEPAYKEAQRAALAAVLDDLVALLKG
jgi:hypothetical protein